MYHELLVALLGYPGSLFSLKENIIDLANFMHPSEKALVKQIIEIAREYQELRTFLIGDGGHKEQTKPPGGTSSNTLPQSAASDGLYMQALRSGLDEALECYRSDIITLEEKILKDPQCNLTFILSCVSKHKDFLSALNSIVREINVKQFRGCLLLQLLHDHPSSKFGKMKDAIQGMMRHCHGIFFKQLSSWVLFGQLTDDYGEFFVQPVKEATNERGENKEYELRPEMIPSYISPSLAHKILSVGQTVLMIGRDPNDQCCGAAGAAQGSHEICGAAVWGGRGQEYFQQLYRLQASPVLDLSYFEKTISLISSCATEHLWVLAVEKADLPNQLRLIKDMFLLSRGELFHEFIHQTQHVLDKPVTKNFSRDVNQAFHAAAHKILVSSEEAKMDKFYFAASGNTSTEGENGWDALVLQYHAAWPLHLLFTPSVLQSYNQLFSFLLRVKKTQMQLHQLWRDQMVNKSSNWRESSIWQIRSWLMFLVDHLQYYLQVDVLESQWSTLQNALRSTRDFEHVRRAHATFLASTLSQSFLLLGYREDQPSTTSYQSPESLKNNMVHKSLSNLLRLCDKFCNTVSVWGSTPSSEQMQDLEPLGEELDNLVNFLLRLLSSLRSQPCGLHLAQLLLRLDFNRWFSLQHGVTTSMTASFL